MPSPKRKPDPRKNAVTAAVITVGAVGLVIFSIFSGALSNAATIFWENTGATFSTGGNWVGGTAPANSLTQDIGSFTNATVAFNPNVTADRSINGLVFTSGTAAWTFSGGNGDTLSLGSSGIVNNSANTQTFNTSLGTFNLALGASAAFEANSGAISVTAPVDLNTFTLTLTGSNNGTISGVISDSGSLVKTGTGTWTLSGANTYTGTTTIGTANGPNAGTLVLGANNALSTNAVTIYGGILDVNTRTNSIGSLAMGGGAAGSTAQVLIGNGGLLTLGGDVTYDAANNPNGALITGTGTGTLALGAASRTFNIGDSSAAASDLTISAIISGAFGITKTGAGELTLSGSNTYTGTTTVSNGVLNIQNNRALGATNGGTTVASGAALEIQGGISVTNEALTISGTGIGTNGALRNISGTNTWAGPITLAAAAEIQSDAGQLTVSGSITSTNLGLTVDGPGNTTLTGPVGLAAANVTKTGAGTLTISGSNSSGGNINILGGTLQVAANTNLGTGGVNIDGGTLKTTATMAITPNTRTVNIGTNGGTISVDPNTTLTYEGFMTGTGKLTKTGTGTFSTGQLDGFNVAASIGGVATSGSGLASFYNFDQLTVGTTNATVTVNTSFGPSNSFTLSLTGDAGVRTGNSPGQWAAPFLSGGNGAGFGTNGSTQPNGVDLTPYLNTGSSTNSSATFNLSQPAQYFGILWGSVDASNSLTFFDATNGFLFTVTGQDVLSSPDGNQGTNGTVYANINSTRPFSRVVATAPTPSFEFDNIATSTNSGRSGPVDVLEGAFQVINNGFFNTVTGTDAVFVATNASLIFNGNTNMTQQTIGNLSGAGSVSNVGSRTLDFRINATSNSTFSGTITDGTNNLNLVKLGSGTQTLSGNNTYDGTTIISNGVLQIGDGGTNGTLGRGAVTNQAGLVINRGGTYLVSNNIAGAGGLTNAGAGTVTLTGSNTLTGPVRVSGGTLVLSNTTGGQAAGGTSSIQVDSGATLTLGANNQIGNSTALILNGGTFRAGTATAGYSDTLGTLTLTADSVIDLGAFTGAHSLTFANSSAIAWATNATLTISNWQGTPWTPGTAGQLLFGTGGLTSTQLSQIRWDPQGFAGAGLIGANGELTPIPEPRVYAAAIALLAAVGWRERKRLAALLRRR
jgi:autotransporter-associated beta strand protein